MSDDATPPAPDAAEQEILSDLELSALLDTTTDPWIYVAHLQQHSASLAARAPHQHRWFQLVRPRPALERESLVAAGARVFGFTPKTAREHLKVLDKEFPETQLAVAATVVTPGSLAEMVFRPDEHPEAGFLLYEFAKGPDQVPEFLPELKGADGRRYLPLGGALAAKGAILFPSQVEDYGDTKQLFGRVDAFIRRLLYIPEGRAQRDGLYTMLAGYPLVSHTYDRFMAVPYLRAIGDLDTGKTTLLDVVGHLCYRPLFASSTTASPIFRILDQVHGTLIIDEADHDPRSELWSELIRIFNAGYRVGFPVLRSERNARDSFDAYPYNVYGPKLLASRHRFADAALESRCFAFETEKVRLPKGWPTELTPADYAEALSLRNQLLLWRMHHWQTIRDGVDQLDAALDASLAPRTRQILRPVLAALKDHPDLHTTIIEQARATNAYVQAERRNSPEAQVLVAMFGIRKNLTHERWTTAAVTVARNLGRPEREHWSTEKVGRLIAKLKFPEDRTAGQKGWKVDLKHLAKKMAEYDLQDLWAKGQGPDHE